MDMMKFKKALGSFSSGKMTMNSLVAWLAEQLRANPKDTKLFLRQLDESYEQRLVNTQNYIHFKRQINAFRRTHSIESESTQDGDNNDEITEFVPTPGQQDETGVGTVTSTTDRTISDLGQGTGEVSVTSGAPVTGGASVTPGHTLDIDLSTTQVKTPEGTVAASNEEVTISPQGGGGELGQDSVIKHRFELKEVLGVGGMGKVYRALDLLKQEARDKKPYVAIKLLSEDFRDHPEAFISLQREASRQQKLAHPNVATIYDFDRIGGPGTPIFITMELMEGMELKEHIKKAARPRGGLPFDEAYEIICQLGMGLGYAHGHRLVHSDFKPSNAFLCNDGKVKILDFGIARAVKNPLTGEAEKTLFDAGKLGALTPAYASLEMLEGKEPDTRDDIYALGCTAYELLIGLHPFNKQPADKAKAKNIIPPTIKHLNKKQNRALQKAIAFRREDRTATVQQFLDDLEGKPTWHKSPFTIAAVGALLLGLILFNPIKDYLHNERLASIVARINAGDQQTILSNLEKISLLEPADKTAVMDQVKEAVQAYFRERIAVLIASLQENYNFREVESVLEEVHDFYPGSVFLQEQLELFGNTKRTFISALNRDYVLALQDRTLIQDIGDLLDKIRKIDPSHALLDDPRAGLAYRKLAKEAFANNDFDSALDLINAGMKIITQDQRLSDLGTLVIREKRLHELEQGLLEVKDQLSELPDFKRYEREIKTLAGLDPNGQLIMEITDKLQLAINEQLGIISQSGSRETAEGMATEYGDLLASLALNDALKQLELMFLSGDERDHKVQAIIADNRRGLDQALETPQVADIDWGLAVLAHMRILKSMIVESPGSGEIVNQYRASLTTLYRTALDELIDEKRFDMADKVIDHYAHFSADLQETADIRARLAQVRAEDIRQENIRSNKADLRVFTEGGNIAEALQTYDRLLANLTEEDVYFKTEAIQLLSDGYIRIANQHAEKKEFELALSFTQDGLGINPGNVVLQNMKNEYEAELNISTLLNLFEDEEVLTFPADTRLKVDQIQNFVAIERSGAFNNKAIHILERRIDTLRKSNETAAAGMAQSAVSIFPFSSVLAKLRNDLQLKPWEQYSAALVAINAGKLSEAQKIQTAAKEAYGTHPQFISFAEILAQKIREAEQIFEIFIKDRELAKENPETLSQARNVLIRAQQFWVDNPVFIQEKQKLDALIARLIPSRIRRREQEITETELAQQAQWEVLVSDSPCTTHLASYGRRSRAICYDLIHAKARGPLLVVVPAGGAIENPFAIGKYEISVGDWSKYCLLSKACKPIKDRGKNEPMTGISLEEVDDYIAWLSKRTEKTYRLPDKEEWVYAAHAQGQQPKKNFNCRVARGNKLIRGISTQSVRSGEANAWGLKHYIGNAQEWVRDQDAVTVRGGAFVDAYSKCDISLERPHDGSADNITSFRLVREEIGE